MTTQELDQAKTEAFAGQMVGMLNGAMTALMVSVGHRTGLFDTMATHAAVDERARSREGADLNERYVREWLGRDGRRRGIVEHDAAAKGTYWLPPSTRRRSRARPGRATWRR